MPSTHLTAILLLKWFIFADWKKGFHLVIFDFHWLYSHRTDIINKMCLVIRNQEKQESRVQSQALVAEASSYTTWNELEKKSNFPSLDHHNMYLLTEKRASVLSELTVIRIFHSPSWVDTSSSVFCRSWHSAKAQIKSPHHNFTWLFSMPIEQRYTHIAWEKVGPVGLFLMTVFSSWHLVKYNCQPVRAVFFKITLNWDLLWPI